MDELMSRADESDTRARLKEVSSSVSGRGTKRRREGFSVDRGGASSSGADGKHHEQPDESFERPFSSRRVLSLSAEVIDLAASEVDEDGEGTAGQAASSAEPDALLVALPAAVPPPASSPGLSELDAVSSSAVIDLTEADEEEAEEKKEGPPVSHFPSISTAVDRVPTPMLSDLVRGLTTAGRDRLASVPGHSSAHNRLRAMVGDNGSNVSHANREYHLRLRRLLSMIHVVSHASRSSGGLSRPQIDALPTNEVSEKGPIQSCVICLEDMDRGQTVRRLPCMHAFHRDCVDEWLRTHGTCPVDKKRVYEQAEKHNHHGLGHVGRSLPRRLRRSAGIVDVPGMVQQPARRMAVVVGSENDPYHQLVLMGSHSESANTAAPPHTQPQPQPPTLGRHHQIRADHRVWRPSQSRPDTSRAVMGTGGDPLSMSFDSLGFPTDTQRQPTPLPRPDFDFSHMTSSRPEPPSPPAPVQALRNRGLRRHMQLPFVPMPAHFTLPDLPTMPMPMQRPDDVLLQPPHSLELGVPSDVSYPWEPASMWDDLFSMPNPADVFPVCPFPPEEDNDR